MITAEPGMMNMMCTAQAAVCPVREPASLGIWMQSKTPGGFLSYAAEVIPCEMGITSVFSDENILFEIVIGKKLC